MKFDKSIKVETFASKDETRPHLCHTHLDTEACVMVATDGHRMIVTPVADIEPDDRTGPITEEALKAARKIAGRYVDAAVFANGALTLSNGTSFPRPKEDGFPPYKQVMPRAGVEGRRTVGVNAKYLASVFTALGDCNVTMTIGGELDPIVFRRHGELGETVIVIMPTRI
jgi:DNA polymerase III sliding clamp (beta) subunit (PCNA family)